MASPPTQFLFGFFMELGAMSTRFSIFSAVFVKKGVGK
jgi:hypothetical protein